MVQKTQIDVTAKNTPSAEKQVRNQIVSQANKAVLADSYASGTLDN